jgi:ABC-2 type transport system ATP-binding protein
MKIATGFLSATEGSVKVAGFDVDKQELESRKHIGYLPEHNPLYLEMYVYEYLEFSGKVYGLNRNDLKSRIIGVIKECGLVVEQNKKIGTLSKGYRQRVGLAQALLHNPKVLILDEPTTGLDPNQILEIRKLIKEVSKNKTVIFSTHIMQEVRALCDRVIIINNGKIILDKTIDELNENNSSSKKYKIEFSAEIDQSHLSKFGTIELIGDHSFALETDSSIDIRSEIFKMASEQNLPLVGLQEEANSLEDIFYNLTTQESQKV